jgi:two-component system phosphate regulon sensor histidine kinase PhoR
MKTGYSNTVVKKFGALMDDALLVVDINSKIIEINPASLRLLGENLKGNQLYDKLECKTLLSDLAFCLQSGQTIEFSASPKMNKFRQMRGRMGAFEKDTITILLMDMTLQHNVEKVRRDFIANVSHELRSPLTSLLGFIETMRADVKMEPTIRENFLKIMDEEAQRMSRLINDLLSLSRVEIEEHIAPTGEVPIKNVIRSVIDTLQNRADAASQDIHLKDIRSNVADEPIIRGELDEITEVFHNLLDNALKYSYEASTINVTISNNPSGDLVIDIKNEGEGINEKHIPRLTERFYRVDKGRSREMGGTGLGLAIVKHIVNKHRGQLDIKSDPKKETVFSVNFPYSPKIQS